MSSIDHNIEQWRIKKLINSLNTARGNGTSMISLIIPPKDQISRITRLLTEEHGTATNIKSRVNRLSVLSAITSAQQRLKLYSRVPPNGLVIYVGTVITEGKEKKVAIDFEPFKPINTSLYLCDNKFHTEALQELLENEESFGFVIMDGNGTLFGTLCGNTKTTLYKFTVDLPKKHNKGGQSATRFAHIRLEKHHHYISKVGELCTKYFISDNLPNVSGLVFAGCANFKSDLCKSDHLDPRLKKIILTIVDVSYNEENGFNEAIELSSELLKGVKFVQEKKLLSQYFTEIAKDAGKICYGLRDTMYALDIGAVETIIAWENLDIVRAEICDKDSVEYLTPEQAAERDCVEKMPLLEWLANNYQQFGASLQFVTDCSQEGSQFCKGFSGIGGMLRYKVDIESELGIDNDEDLLNDDEDLLNDDEEFFI